MENNNTENEMKISKTLPVYPMGVAAKILNLHPRTLRIYENEGLIKPQRIGGKRMFSKNDLLIVQCLRRLIHDENISIPGLKKLLDFTPCWKLNNCPEDTQKSCCGLMGKNKKCWEFTQHICEKSCESCEVYIRNKIKVD